MNGAAKYILYILYILLAIILGVFLRIGWVVFYPYNPMIVHEIRIIDDDNTVAAGEILNYQEIYTKNLELPATVNRWLQNSYVLPVSPYNRNVPLGKGTVPNQIEIPDFASAGTYRLIIEYSYRVSSFPERIVKVHAASGPFTIVNKDKAIQRALVESAIENKAGIKANDKLLNALSAERKKYGR